MCISPTRWNESPLRLKPVHLVVDLVVTSRINVDHPSRSIDWKFLRHKTVITEEHRVDPIKINRTRWFDASLVFSWYKIIISFHKRCFYQWIILDYANKKIYTLRIRLYIERFKQRLSLLFRSWKRKQTKRGKKKLYKYVHIVNIF